MTANVISALALTLAIVTAAVTQIQRAFDTRRIVRQQLTDVLSKITDWQVKAAESPGSQAYLAPAATTQARLAAMLIDQLPGKLVTDTDYVMLASAAVDPVEAKRNYDKAIAAARTVYYRRLARRGYGSFLFAIGDFAAARQQFQTAIDEVSEPGDEGHALRCDLHSTWATFEGGAGHAPEAAQQSALAEAELSQIVNPAWRRWYSNAGPAQELPGQPAAAAPVPAG